MRRDPAGLRDLSKGLPRTPRTALTDFCANHTDACRASAPLAVILPSLPASPPFPIAPYANLRLYSYPHPAMTTLRKYVDVVKAEMDKSLLKLAEVDAVKITDSEDAAANLKELAKRLH
jgi:hypothetical protein